MTRFFDTIKDFISGSTMTNAGSDEDWIDQNAKWEDYMTDDDTEDYYDEPEYCYEEPEPRKREHKHFFRPDFLNEEAEETEYSEPRVVEFNPVKTQEVLVIRPKSIEDSQAISRELRAGRVVICNFEGMDNRPAQRVMDFLSGSAFSLDGHVMPISNKVFVITPRHTAISEGLSSDQEDKTMEHLRRAANS